MKHNEKPTSEELRYKEQTYYEDVHEGMELPRYIYQPTPTHLFRWSAAIENWHRIHYDLDFAINHRKAAQRSGARVMEAEHGAPVPQGLDPAWWLAGGKPPLSTGQCWCPVTFSSCGVTLPASTRKLEWASWELEFGMKNQDGSESMPGAATVVLPLRGGRPIPYPFVPPED